ncbi:response regulator [Fulvivirga sediminis]|uniref:Response regulator transcription factor n=1 Tax=Fulvivirga sediminis TaxID=2803949 RepID=A0A937F5F0_9BACT|nr:response regulator transcription factor [Fulvivirga sediminis]MBL3654589.1 response regulator transcription factor [Fulvivirga sediminis]
MDNIIKLMLVDDHEIVRKGIKVLLDGYEEFEVVSDVGGGKEALGSLTGLKPDLLIMDNNLLSSDGVELVNRAREMYSNLPIMILTARKDEKIITKYIDAGVDGYLLKYCGVDELVRAIQTVSSGQKYISGEVSDILVSNYLSAKKAQKMAPELQVERRIDYGLTKRERQILKLIYSGISNKEIAEQLDKSIRTIETHRFNIMKKLEVSNVSELFHTIENEPSLKMELTKY